VPSPWWSSRRSSWPTFKPTRGPPTEDARPPGPEDVTLNARVRPSISPSVKARPLIVASSPPTAFGVGTSAGASACKC
jgi:hypothetical protein